MSTIRVVKINIPDFVEQYFFTFYNGEELEHEEIFEEFLQVFSTLKESVQKGVKSFLSNYLEKKKLSNDPCFVGILEKIP